MATTMMVIFAAGSVGSSPVAATAREVGTPMQQAQPQVCEMVVTAERNVKPYKLCMTRAEWQAKKIADAKDANRIICHYEEQMGTRFRSAKVCMPASEWDDIRRLQRQELEQVQMQTQRF
jgi:hypothetical protein